MISDIQTAYGSGRRFDPGGVRQGSFRACRSYQFSKVCETLSTAMPCLWHGLRMGETGEPRTGGGKQRTGRSRALADIMPVVGCAAFRRFGFVQSSVVSRWPAFVGDRYAALFAHDSIRFPCGERDGGTLPLVVAGAVGPL